MKNWLGEELKKLRMKENLSLEALAEAANTTHSSLSRWERGIQSPRVTSLERVLAVYGKGIAIVKK